MYVQSLNQHVESIKNSDEDINRFVEEYKPFIAACVEKVTGRFVRYGEDDELSIALMAFVEAIKAYDFNKGNYLSFAQNVIKRRLIDYFRKEKKHGNVISIYEFSRDDSEENNETDLSAGESIERFTDEELSEYRRMEIEELKRELSIWEISFFEVAGASPKHQSTREVCRSIIKFMISRPEYIAKLKSSKQLPVADIEKNTGIPRKKIDRARKYIIAVIIIATGDYQYIRDYIHEFIG